MTHVVTAPTLSQLPGGRKNSWRVRWRVDGRARTKHFPTKTAALAFLSKVNSARTSGRDFDDDTGAPILKSTLVKAGPTFAEAAQEIVRTSWDSLLGTSRHGLVAGLSQVISVTCSANIDRSTIYAAAFAQLSGVELDRTPGAGLSRRHFLFEALTPPPLHRSLRRFHVTLMGLVPHRRQWPGAVHRW